MPLHLMPLTLRSEVLKILKDDTENRLGQQQVWFFWTRDDEEWRTKLSLTLPHIRKVSTPACSSMSVYKSRSLLDAPAEQQTASTAVLPRCRLRMVVPEHKNAGRVLDVAEDLNGVVS